MYFGTEFLRKRFETKKNEVREQFRILHNVKLRGLYRSPCIVVIVQSRRLRWARNADRIGKTRNAYRILVGKLFGKRPLGGLRRSGRMTFRLMGCDDGM
jgi:hypothetical protein